ncbi:uncharacterized protein [Euphorbia lathyris]|uniref:uncharacterized protein n=1 Tax=Euphorbia lathyris TaxID=212925 RepID=UPI003313C499
MNISDQDKQDQRARSGMRDSSAMTIEFLRARLLSERSVSSTARQRADELAKRVSELEEQLRIVSLQRMKAEKATEAVLAILEGNGISDVSETYDSSSDQDTPYKPKVSDRSSKEESFANSKVRNNESEEFSGSDIDFSPVPGRSLSWKGRKETSRSLERYKECSLRRRSSFAAVASSSKNHPGKSCRKIRHKESRSVAEEFKANPVKVDSLEGEVNTKSENSPNSSGEPGSSGSNVEKGEEKMSMDSSVSGCLGNEQNGSDNGLKCNGYGGDRDMEEALEHQAQLIGQYEAMEKAQREWEEKFRENNNSTPDSCDPGNRSDVTEETYEVKSPVASPGPTITTYTRTHEVRSQVAADVSKIPGSGVIPSLQVDVEHLEERKESSMPVSESSTQDFAFPMANGMQNKQIFHNDYHPLSLTTSSWHDSRASQTAPSFPSSNNGGLRKEETSRNQNEHYMVVPHRASEGLGGVLDALKDAKKLLQQRIDKLPSVATPAKKYIEPSDPARVPKDEAQIPVGCVGLFRLPTDFSAEGHVRADFPSLNAQLRSGNYYPDAGAQSSGSSQFVSSPYTENWSMLPAEDEFLRNGSRIPSKKPYFDPYLDTGLPSSSKYSYPNYPINTSYPDLMPRMASREAFSAASLQRRSLSFDMPSQSNLSFMDDKIRPSMYR